MTVGREQPTCRAISVFEVPSAASSKILARSAKAARMLWDRLHWPRVRRSSGGMASGGAMAGMNNPAATTPQPPSKFRDGLLVSNPDWAGELAVVLHTLGRGAELLEPLGRLTTPTPWLQAAGAIARGRFDRAADLYAQIGSVPDEAFARLQAAKQLLAAGRRAEGTAHLQRVVAFYREVQASAYLREAEMLLAATA